MRLTMRTNLAMRVLMACAVNKDHIVRRAQVARTINASENHIAQVVNMLSAAGFLTTTRGRAGGLALARAPSEISIGEVFRHFEAGLPFAECFAGAAIAAPCVPPVACVRRSRLRWMPFTVRLTGPRWQILLTIMQGWRRFCTFPSLALSRQDVRKRVHRKRHRRDESRSRLWRFSHLHSCRLATSLNKLPLSPANPVTCRWAYGIA